MAPTATTPRSPRIPTPLPRPPPLLAVSAAVVLCLCHLLLSCVPGVDGVRENIVMILTDDQVCATPVLGQWPGCWR